MMISTLNALPDEPARHMKEYIGLHYFFEQNPAGRSQRAVDSYVAEVDGVKRDNLRQKDLQELRE